MDQMIGDWSMVRGNGRAICGLTLTNTEATPDNFAVFLKPRCDPAVAAFAPTVWRLERGEVLLMWATGGSRAFRASANPRGGRGAPAPHPRSLARTRFSEKTPGRPLPPSATPPPQNPSLWPAV